MRRRWLSGLGVALAVAAAAAAAGRGPASSGSAPDPVLSRPWSTNGEVSALAVSWPTLYVGGNFTQVGPMTGPLVALQRKGGERARSFPSVSGGAVSTIVADGRGGWLIGGDFDSIGAVRCARLARVTADLRIDTNWCPHVAGPVRALALDGARLFVGGTFGRIAGARRTSLAALDAVTARLLPWPVELEAGPFERAAVNDLAVHDHALYVLGFWERIAAKAQHDLAALDTATAELLAWDPGPPRAHDPHDGDYPSVAALEPGRSALFVSGQFTRIGGSKRTYIAALDYETGRATGWRPPVSWRTASGFDEMFPSTMTAANGRLYIGGSFRRLGGRARDGLAALSERTGAVLPWKPAWPIASTEALAVAGDTVYAVGVTDPSDGPRVLEAFDTRTAYRRRWQAAVPGGHVGVIVASRSLLVVGGDFAVAGGALRHNIAALDLRTGTATAWDPDVGSNDPSAVEAIVATPGAVFATGEFTQVGDQPRRGTTVISPATGRATWRPPPDDEYPPPPHAVIGSTLYLVAPGHADRGSPDRIEAFDLVTGRRSDWSVSVGVIEALSTDGKALYAGISNGEWDRDLVRHSLATIDVPRSTVTLWDVVIDAKTGTGEITTLEISDGRLYVGGQFDRVGDARRDGLASFDLRTKELTAWHPTLGDVGGLVNAVAVTPTAVYVGGVSQFGAFDRRSGRRLSFRTAPLTTDSSVNDLVVVGRSLYVASELGLVRLRTVAG